MGQIQFYDRQDRFWKAGLERRAAIHAKKMQEVQASLEQLHMKFKVDEECLLENTKLREKKIRDQIEIVIKLEEDKVKARLEAEKRAREEAEWKRKEEERKLKEEEDRKRAEENKRKAEENKKKEEEAKQKEEEQEKEKLEDEPELLEQENLRVQREESEKEQRKELGMSTTPEDWPSTRTLLKVDMYPSPNSTTNCL